MRIPSMVFLICCLALTSGFVNAQSVSMSPIPRTSYCVGDPISVTFTATGTWGPKNAFTLQLSDATGSFANTFKNIGSINGTAAGTFTISSTIPTGITGSTHYRIRITGALPYTASTDNGQDITMGVKPSIDLEIADFTTYVTTSVGGLFLPVGAQVDSTVQILLPHIDSSSASSIKYDWDFGSDATPPNASALGLIKKNVAYSTAGDKTVSVTATDPAGCSTSASINYHIFDCTNPSIPKYALIDSGQNADFHGGVIWVNPGVAFSIDGGKDTLFCESGSAIVNNGVYNVIYLKPGASYTESRGGAYSTVIYSDGVSLDLNNPPYRKLIHCPNLDFDYTNAPPNAAHPLEGVVYTSLPSLTISPNPTRGIISIQDAPSNDLNISVLNILGETVMQLKNVNSPDFTLDISKLVPGTYYIRFSLANSVVTKKIIKN